MKKITWTVLLALHSFSVFSEAATPIPTAAKQAQTINASAAPTRNLSIFFKNDSAEQKNYSLRGIKPEQSIEFTVRKDEIATAAVLKLQFTPSPSLIPLQSQLKIYLNDELMSVISITPEQLGKPNSIELPIDPRYIVDFNRLQLKFIGHYKAICENPASTTLWIDISQSSSLSMTLQTLQSKNDLAWFPKPFFDALDNRPLELPMVFAKSPGVMQQKAAGILASWFGTKALWRPQSYPTYFNQLPLTNSIVFVTNKDRPDFLKNYKNVTAPTVEMINHPDNPYVKILLISGQDDKDLITAVKGIAQGNILFRGDSVTVNNVETIAPRQPYDAPNWVHTDRPTTFAELQKYKEQLQTSGFSPNPISLSFNVPPDLFLAQSNGINVKLKYRYTPPPAIGKSFLNVNLNNYFVQSYQLIPDKNHDSKMINLSIMQNLLDSTQKLIIPVLKIGSNNQFSFDFAYTLSISGGTDDGHCESFSMTNNYANIDRMSTIDFSNYRHYLAMPNLSTFAMAGFPFSRLADLSETWVLVNKEPQPEEVSVLLNTLANIGAQTGFPALAVSLGDDWSEMENKDADILIIGNMPSKLSNNSTFNLLLEKTRDTVNQPFRQNTLPNLPFKAENTAVNSKTSVSANRGLSAIIGGQSPIHKARSIIALLAVNSQDFKLLNKALTDKTQQYQIFGSVAVIRNSGVDSVQVGAIYHIGHLPWWLRIWFTLQNHPWSMAFSALLGSIILTILLWRGLKAISHRRLKIDD